MKYTKQLEEFIATEDAKEKIIVIYGPTGSGKTSMSIDIAKYLDSEIISTDSRQIFRYMDVLTGKITREEAQGVKHHMIDVVDPDQRFSVGDFRHEVLPAINTLHKKGKIPLLVGGTGLYIDSIIFDFSLGELPADESLRRELDLLSSEELYKKLQDIDPEYALELHPNNRVYVERALEIKMLTGKSKRDYRRKKELTYDVLFLSPDYSDRAALYQRINARVEKMFTENAIEEVRDLIKKGYGENDFGMNSIGYREFFPYFRGEILLSEVQEKIQQHSRNYAKRQINWFSKYERLKKY